MRARRPVEGQPRPPARMPSKPRPPPPPPGADRPTQDHHGIHHHSRSFHVRPALEHIAILPSTLPTGSRVRKIDTRSIQITVRLIIRTAPDAQCRWSIWVFFFSDINLAPHFFFSVSPFSEIDVERIETRKWACSERPHPSSWKSTRFVRALIYPLRSLRCFRVLLRWRGVAIPGSLGVLLLRGFRGFRSCRSDRKTHLFSPIVKLSRRLPIRYPFGDFWPVPVS